MKRITFLIAAVMAFGIIPAQAHGDITARSQQQNSVLIKIPTKVWIQFNGNLINIAGSRANYIQVTDSSGLRVDLKDSKVQGNRVTVTLKKAMKAGLIKVSYRIVSQDGHPVQGNYSLTYQPKK